MPNEYEVRKVPKVVVQSIRPGEVIQATPANQYWYVVERIEDGERYGEFDDEADAIADCEKRNSTKGHA